MARRSGREIKEFGSILMKTRSASKKAKIFALESDTHRHIPNRSAADPIRSERYLHRPRIPLGSLLKCPKVEAIKRVKRVKRRQSASLCYSVSPCYRFGKALCFQSFFFKLMKQNFHQKAFPLKRLRWPKTWRSEQSRNDKDFKKSIASFVRIK